MYGGVNYLQFCVSNLPILKLKVYKQSKTCVYTKVFSSHKLRFYIHARNLEEIQTRIFINNLVKFLVDISYLPLYTKKISKAEKIHPCLNSTNY